MNVLEAYAEWSHTYDDDRNLTRDLDEEVMRRSFAGASYRAVLEIGCGTGKNTALLAQIADRVEAIDFSEAMIERARRRLPSGQVKFSVADLTKHWPVDDSSINLISCNLVLEHISDLCPVFAQAGRVLSAGGEFFVSELHPFRQYQGVQARFARDSGTIAIPAFVHHVSDFLDAAAGANLSLQRLQEWWHAEDNGKPIDTHASGVLKPVDRSTPEACLPMPPRLISFLFRKPE